MPADITLVGHETYWKHSVACARWPCDRVGVILCITIIGIPVGKQAFKMAKLTLTPFGTQVVYGGGAGSAILNFIWVIFVGLWFAIGYVVAGVANCITIIGIPFGLQSFKMAKLALFPFGTQIV